MLHESILDQSNWDLIQCVVAGDCSCKFIFDLVIKKFNSAREIKVFLTFEFAQVNMDHLMVFYSAVLN